MLFERKARTINRLLVVEDEPLVAFDNEHALGDAGYTVVATVDRVRDAIAALETAPVDLVLCDVKLTGERSGVELARHVKPLGIPLLFVTASCPIDASEMSLGVLAKPYSGKTLIDSLAAVERHLAGKKARRLPGGLTLYPLVTARG